MRRLGLFACMLLLPACGGGSGSEPLVVFAASSLGEVAPQIEPEATVVLGGSNELAAQLRDGAAAGVFLSASSKPVEELRAAGIVERPIAFASNRLVVVTPPDDRAAASLADLERPGTKVVLGGEGVPVGDYARQALRAAGLERALTRVVSLEADANGVLGKVALGEADAGIVYATDARAARGKVRSFPVPARYQPRIRYYAALVSPGSESARRWLDRLLGEVGRAALRRGGFLQVDS